MAHPQKAFISGCHGLDLSEEEKAFFRDERPWGFILFKRNCDNPEQIKRICDDLRQAADFHAPIFIDQEGGRVQWLAPPHWRKYPTGRAYAQLFDKDAEKGARATYLGARLIAHDLMELGIDADCLPVLDVPVPGAHDVIGDRAYGNDPETIATLGRHAANGLLAGGVLPVIKHIPGHGCAGVDSHHHLPVVDCSLKELTERDFLPFQKLADLPMAMTAHVVYTALDDQAPCSISQPVIQGVVRDIIGFSGLLMSDDVSMNALDGEIGERTQSCFAAGCDFVLHCNGKLDEMRAVAENTPALASAARERAEAALNWRRRPDDLDHAAALQELEDLLAAL